jgi:hypothetical protein
MQSVVRDLERLRRQGWLLLVAQRGALLTTVGVVSIILLIAADYAFRFPAPLRLTILLLGCAALLLGVWRFLRPALTFRPDLTALALRVERTVPALRGRLASSLEFVGSGLESTNPLAARVVHETARRADGALGGLIQPRRTLAALGVLAGALVIAGAGVAALPELAGIGLARLFAPLSHAPWPSRTRVESAVEDGVRPRGQAVPLRALVTLGDPRTRVTARHRAERGGEPGPWRTVVLTFQEEAEQPASGSDLGAAGGLLRVGVHEQLVDGDAEAIEFQFRTEDFESPLQRIELVQPPAIRRALLRADPPAHAAHLSPVRVELGGGTDDRAAAAPPLLIGSTARLELELVKPVPMPTAAAVPEGSPSPAPAWETEWLKRTLGAASSTAGAPTARPTLEVDDPLRWALSWRADAPLELLLTLEDEHGITNVQDIVYRVAVLPDGAPSAAILEPQSDETVSPQALVKIQAEGRDDIGVASLRVECQRQRGDLRETLPSFEAAPGEAGAAPAQTVALDAALDLAALGAQPGDLYILQAVAADAYELDGMRHEPARSTQRTLRVVTASDIGEQLRRQLASLRQSAIRIDAQQAEISDAVDAEAEDAGAEGAAPTENAEADAERAARRAAAGPSSDRRQGQIGERLADQRGALEAVAARLVRNQLDDPELDATLDLARDHLDRAADASNRAGQALRRARNAGAGRDATDAEPSAAGPEGTSEAPAQPDSPRSEMAQGGRPDQSAVAPQGQPGPRGQAGEPREAGRAETVAQESSQTSRADAQRAQSEVRDELADLIELLNRDADAWSLTRQVERLAEEVRQMERDTARLGQRTVGRDREALPAAEQTELERIAMAQRDAAERARELTDSLQDRAQRRESQAGNDSGVLRQAAETAQEEQLAEQLEEAGRQVQGNRMQNAQANQAAARRTLERMLGDLREGRRAQARELQRQLASLIESIRRLEALQEDEISALAMIPEGEGEQAALEQRSRSMIRLNQNTDGVTEDARRTGRGAERVARLLAQASTSQGEAVAALRARPARRVEAVEREELALSQLRDARAAAETAQERAEAEEAQERREALLKRYRDAQELQRMLLDEVQALARQGDGGRRALLETRRAGGRQQKLREAIGAIRTESEDVSNSPVFSRAHQDIDEYSASAEARLAEGDAGATTTVAQEAVVSSLQAIITALEEDAPEEEPFEAPDGGPQEEGGGQQGDAPPPPVIPPRAELKLLKGLQEQVYRQTRMLDGSEVGPSERAESARAISRRQAELADLARQMIERLRGGAEPAP